MSLEDKVKGIVVDALAIKPEELDLEGPLVEDSTELVEVVVALKKSFNVEIATNEIVKTHTFNDVIGVLKAKGIA